MIRVSIIRFSNDVEILQELTDDKELASNKLSQLEPVENTALNDALIVGTRTLRDSAERRVLLLITDGVDFGISQASFEEAVTEIAKHNIVLHTIGWLGVNGTALQDLADLTHGSFQSISNSYPDLLALQSAFQNVSRDLVNQRQLYHLSYTSNLKADAGEHEMNVSVDHLGMHAENSRHFVATPNQVSVEMTDLAPEQSIWGSVVFEPTVVAPAPIAKFDVLIDGNSIGSVIKEPFQLDWDSRQTPGRHEFTFIATDSAGNSGQISIPLNVELPLIAQIESPSDGAQIKDATDVVIGVSGPSELHQLEVFVDSNSIGKIEDPSRQDLYKIPWDLSGATEGAHTISIVAEDLDGFQSQDSIKVNLVLGGTGPLAIVIAVVVVAALIIPLGLRSRKRRTKTAISGESSEGSEHAPSGSMVLLELSGLNPNHVWSFESSEIRLGRKRDANDIPLQGTRASRRHAVIQFQQGECIVTSLNPENPILVNNVPVTNKALSPGDILKAGDTVLRFEGKGS